MAKKLTHVQEVRAVQAKVTTKHARDVDTDLVGAYRRSPPMGVVVGRKIDWL